jgi:hypothetical protein
MTAGIIKAQTSVHFKGEMEWETRAARKIRKRVRNRTLKSRSKSQMINWISNPKGSLDRSGAEICTTAFAL